MSKIQKVIDFQRHIANDPEHGYDQINRYGVNFDCSGLAITSWDEAGVKVKAAGATYTGNMKAAFIKCGFKDVIKTIDLETGEGLLPGDQLLRVGYHTATYIGNGEIVQAQSNEKGTTTGGKTGDQTGKEIAIKPYYNSLPHWDAVLRYTEAAPAPAKFTVSRILKQTSPMMRGSDVYDVQKSLNARGFNSGNNDGVFGGMTRIAVVEYQRAAHLTVDGIVGKHTVESLGGTWN